jgi:hypothetical protein
LKNGKVTRESSLDEVKWGCELKWGIYRGLGIGKGKKRIEDR